MTLKGRDCIVLARPFLFRSYQSPLYFACTVPTSLSRLTADSVRCCEGDTVIFRQLFEPLSSTYAYLLGCEEPRQAVLIDPVLMAVERDLAEFSRLDLTLAYTLFSLFLADHVTAALELKRRADSKIAAPAYDRLPCVDVGIEEGTPFDIGGIRLRPLHTPGHTEGHYAYAMADRAFTGDALLIECCGHTKKQNDDTETKKRSVREKLFTLAEEGRGD